MSDQTVDTAPAAAAEGDAPAPVPAPAAASAENAVTADGQKPAGASDGTPVASQSETDGSAAPDSAGKPTAATDTGASGDGVTPASADGATDAAAKAEKPATTDAAAAEKSATDQGEKPAEAVTAPAAAPTSSKDVEKAPEKAADAVDGKSAETTPSAGEAVVVCGVNITEVSDQDKLHEMLEQCDNFDERKKIRARLTVLMQEAKGNDTSADAKMSSSTSSVVTKTSTSKTVTSSQRSQLTKGKAPVSAFDKFKQLDSANPKPIQKTDSGSSDGGGFKLDAGLAAKAQGAKEMTLYWAQCRTRDYQNVKIENFSTSWNDGMAFCALIHHFYPDAFDFDKLNPKNRRYNFDLAFKTADEKAGIYPLLDTDDMVAMRKPDWKCVFTYVQAIYRRLKDGPVAPNA